MSKIIYHLGTGTYFSVDDDVVVIDTDDVSVPIDADLMETEGYDIAWVIGKPIINIITEEQ